MPRPRQARSKARLAALTQATETLLRRTTPEDLTVNELAREAGVSAAYLYTRFDSKQALLDSLIHEFETGQRDKAARLLQPQLWEGIGLEERISRLARQFLTAARSHRGLMRAIFSRRVVRGVAGQGEAEAEAGPSFGASDQILEWLMACRKEIAHEDPREAIRLSLLVLFSTLQVALFLDLAESAHRAIAREVVGMLTTYLLDGSGAPLELIGELDREQDS